MTWNSLGVQESPPKRFTLEMTSDEKTEAKLVKVRKRSAPGRGNRNAKVLKAGRNLTVSVCKNKARMATDSRVSWRKIQG